MKSYYIIGIYNDGFLTPLTLNTLKLLRFTKLIYEAKLFIKNFTLNTFENNKFKLVQESVFQSLAVFPSNFFYY